MNLVRCTHSLCLSLGTVHLPPDLLTILNSCLGCCQMDYSVLSFLHLFIYLLIYSDFIFFSFIISFIIIIIIIIIIIVIVIYVLRK